jgi:sirohydrochlorin ferrochelatase
MSTVMLVDNGSQRPESTLSLRRLASDLSECIGRVVHPVSLLHASKISPEDLGGRPADTFEPFLRRQLATGVRDFVVLPLFFGRSRALTEFIPETVAVLVEELGPFEVRVGDTLYPLPAGEPRLVEILCDNVRQVTQANGLSAPRVVLVDHGSPILEVTAVRQLLAVEMRSALGGRVTVDEAVMERREGSEYDFNGSLLRDRLRRLAEANPFRPAVLAMLFLLPGRHAGPGGDIDRICRAVVESHRAFRVYPTALVGSHPVLVEILRSRYEQIR